MTQTNSRAAKILFIAAVLSIGALLAALIALNAGNSKLKSDLDNRVQSLAKATAAGAELDNALRKVKTEYTDLQKKLEEITAQRQQLDVQVKGLLSDRDLARKLEGERETLKADKEIVQKQKEAAEKARLELDAQIAALKDKIRGLETVQVQLYKEKEQVAASLTELRDKTGVKKLEDENAALKKENGALSKSLNQAQSELEKLKNQESKLREDFKKQSAKLEDAEKNLQEQARKFKAFEQTYVDAPLKCADLARQNKTLIRRTANMHYNMGVFYTKQKEYSRAISEFEKAVQLAPDDAASYFNLGYIYAEYIQHRQRAIEYFRKYLQYADKNDKDTDWAKKYILTWQAWDGKQPM
ncbi:MAG: tetratricopeptide repeat protein [Candidatus Omnitrophica bacterium]|nr:tetratricopeptide repeat protein [Candidatus Omnitrophota bacterium]